MLSRIAAASLIAVALPAQAAPHAPAAAPSFVFRVPGLAGGTLSAEDFKGRILIVDVWATWCGPCRIVIPHLNALADKYKSRGLSVIGISADEKDGVGDGYDRVRRFAAEHRMTYAVGLMDGPTYLQVLQTLGSHPAEGFAIPATIILGRDGRVIRTFEGYYRGQEQDLEALVSDLLRAEAAREKKP